MSDFAEKNREHFNNTAASYNSKFEKTISAIIEEIQARLDWIGVDWISDSSDDDDETSRTSAKPSDKKTVRLLDYACGTGLVSRALAPYVTQCVGMDISENMVETYNTTAQNQGLPKSEMSAVVGNLLSPTDATPSALAGPEYHNFDIAVVGLGFHHFEDPKLAAKRLGERLKKGGVLFIIDFLPHDQHHFHGHDAQKAKHTVMHLGFSEEDVKTMFSGAGCDGGFEYSVVGKGIVFVTDNGQTEQMKREVFMARGSKL